MINVGSRIMSNLGATPKSKTPKENNESSMGLLSRTKQKTESNENKEPRARVADYVSEIRTARLELKNGRK